MNNDKYLNAHGIEEEIAHGIHWELNEIIYLSFMEISATYSTK